MRLEIYYLNPVYLNEVNIQIQILMADDKNPRGDRRPRNNNYSNTETIQFEEVAPLEVPEEIANAASTPHDDFDWTKSAKH